MTDEVVDTTAAPAESVEPTEPTELTELTELTDAVEPTEPPEPQPPAYITADQLKEALETQEQSSRSWLGRRDKELMSHVGQVISERFTSQQNQPSPEETSSRLLDNPRDVIRSEMDAYKAETSMKETTHMNSTMESVGNLMETDPLYQDKELGGEVVAEIKNLIQTGSVNMNVPASEAGKIMLGDALSNVFRKRQGSKTNPLSTNTPQNTSGNLTPPAAPPVKKVKVPPLDDITKKMADKWGYKDEDLATLYGE